MATENDRLDRVENILVEVARDIRELNARQRYHHEAFERFDVRMREIQTAIAADGENIRTLARIAELHDRRLDHLEGGETA
jgi:hypothetical protein